MTYKTLPLPAKSNRQINEYVQAVEKGMDSYFVVQNGKGWYVRKASERNTYGKLFPAKAEAIDYARTMARKRDSEYLIFSKKGELLQRSSE